VFFIRYRDKRKKKKKNLELHNRGEERKLLNHEVTQSDTRVSRQDMKLEGVEEAGKASFLKPFGGNEVLLIP
jgi:hypothetical protein